MTTKPKTPDKKNTTINQHEAAFKSEVRNLQKKNAKLEAQLFTANAKLKLQEPIIRAAQKKSDEHERLKRLANEALNL